MLNSSGGLGFVLGLNKKFFALSTRKNKLKIQGQKFPANKDTKSLKRKFICRRKFLRNFLLTVVWTSFLNSKIPVFGEDEFFLENEVKRVPKKKLKRFNYEFYDYLNSSIEKFISFGGSIVLACAMISISFVYQNKENKISNIEKNYSSEKIDNFYRSRPEKIIIRSMQVLWELVSLLGPLFYSKFVLKGKNNERLVKKNRHKNPELFYTNFIKKKFSLTKKYQKNISLVLGSIISSKFSQVLIIVEKQKKIEKDLKDEKQFLNKIRPRKVGLNLYSPVITKVAQVMASRPDLIGKNYAKELEVFQDNFGFFSNEAAFKVIKEDLGTHPSKIFSEFEPTPVSAASLGQVYKAKLNGIGVAIKVQNPKIKEIISLDLLILRKFGALVNNFFGSKTDLINTVDEYGERLFEEVNYTKEATNMIKFRSFYGYMERIEIPRVFSQYSSKRILVMDWIDGEKILTKTRNNQQEDIALIEIGIRCSLIQLLEIGFLHCDPHAGNLMKTSEGNLAYLDFGLVSEVPETFRFYLVQTFLHFLNEEYSEICNDLSGMSLIRKDDLELERESLKYFFEVSFDKKNSSFEFFSLQNIIETVLKISVQFPLVLPPYFLNNLRALSTLEGLGLSADPNFKLANLVYPFIINRLLTNPNIQFNKALENFVIDKNSGKAKWEILKVFTQDPEWTEVYPELSENSYDALLNFVVSPCGKFFRKAIIREIIWFSENFRLFYKNPERRRKNITKKINPEKKILTPKKASLIEYNESNSEIAHLIQKSRCYSMNTFMKIILVTVEITLTILLELSVNIIQNILSVINNNLKVKIPVIV